MHFTIINGEPREDTQATLHVSDLGLRRGYAVFEFFRVTQRVPLFLEDHLERLWNSARLAELELPINQEDLQAQVTRLISLNDMKDGAVQIVLTGGYSADLFTVTQPNLIVTPVAIEPLPNQHRSHGVKLITERHVRELPQAKTTAYLTAMRLAKRMHAAEAMEIVYYDEQRVYEASRAGLAYIKNGTLVTSGDLVLESISMKHLLSVAKPILDIEQRTYTLAELLAADEVLTTGSIRGIIPAVLIDNHRIGTGRVGPVARHLANLFESHIEGYVNRWTAAVR
jgi:branched-chain amino acid aminotransferase